MGTYNIPRNVKGEGRILFVFSIKSFIFTAIAGGAGFLIALIFFAMGLRVAGLMIVGIFALLGFAIGALKIPEGAAMEISRKVGGENIDDVIKRAIAFKQNGKKIYVYKEGKTNDK